MSPSPTNRLANQTSPYLLQHAYNPVDWYSWGDEALARAREENKPLLISIGYAACHWCHVMEKESFEDKAVAASMNRHFINIKIDREERPDIDLIYMEAVQLMTGTGGWPLNVVALPDGNPFWGGTYFRKETWIEILHQLSHLYKTQPQRVIEYAKQLQEGIIQRQLIAPSPAETPISLTASKQAIHKWTAYFDEEYGGANRSPKFMMPVNLHCLLHYAVRYKDQAILNYVQTTLTRMAYGGIYDTLGGGFSRYSTDKRWHIPHFEKMLYDNAQLVSLYSDAYCATKNNLYKEIALQTLEFVQREWLSPQGGFYASWDADSLNASGEWEEGAFYVWRQEELKTLLGINFPVFADYYNINPFGHWEEGRYVLIQNLPPETVAEKHGYSPRELHQVITACKHTLQTERAKRPKPRLDNKILTSWNALMVKAYANAYQAFGEANFLKAALRTATFIQTFLYKEDGGLYRQPPAYTTPVEGFLEDYATLCEAFITLYEVTAEEKWVREAQRLVQYCYDYFYDEESGFFHFTSHTAKKIVAQPIETADNVLPASNSILAKALWKLARYFQNNRYAATAQHMLEKMAPEAMQYPYSYANWLSLAFWLKGDFYECVFAGSDAKELLTGLRGYYLPDAVIALAHSHSSLPLLQDKDFSGERQIYICKNNRCFLPTTSMEEALTLLEIN